MQYTRSLFPPIEPFNSGFLGVGYGHSIYFEQCGNPEGKPAVYIHGGPGSGCNPDQRRVFDPDKFHIILFDQRGCGRSKPHSCLDNNTTWDLVADMEKLRQHLDLETWLVCGGSWGSTLSLAYAQTHPESVSELVLRGIFTLRQSELDWFYQGGAAAVFPDEWEKFVEPIDPVDRGNFISAYYQLLTGADPDKQAIAARAWSKWEGSTINLLHRPDQIDSYGQDAFAIAFARIETHYFYHKGFFEYDGWLLDQIDRIRHIPTTIVQGRYDMCTPMATAWDLHKAFPEADFHIIDDAGHAFDEPGITDALIQATDLYADI